MADHDVREFCLRLAKVEGRKFKKAMKEGGKGAAGTTSRSDCKAKKDAARERVKINRNRKMNGATVSDQIKKENPSFADALNSFDWSSLTPMSRTVSHEIVVDAQGEEDYHAPPDQCESHESTRDFIIGEVDMSDDEIIEIWISNDSSAKSGGEGEDTITDNTTSAPSALCGMCVDIDTNSSTRSSEGKGRQVEEVVIDEDERDVFDCIDAELMRLKDIARRHQRLPSRIERRWFVACQA